jgi:hypothetical protein
MADSTTPAQDGWGPSPIPGLLPQIDFEVPADNKVFTVIDPPRGRPAMGGGVHRRLKQTGQFQRKSVIGYQKMIMNCLFPDSLCSNQESEQT